MRVTPAQLDELLHPIIDPKVEKEQKVHGEGAARRPRRRDPARWSSPQTRRSTGRAKRAST